jgi:zinc protease
MIPLIFLAALLTSMPFSVDLSPARVVGQADPGAQLVGIDLTFPAGTSAQPTGKNGVAALALESILHATRDGLPLTTRVVRAGGVIDGDITPNAAHITIEALPEALPAIAHEIATALAPQDITPATLAAIRSDLAQRERARESDPVTAGREMLLGALYAGEAGQPAYGIAPALQALTPDDVRNFLAARYLRGDAVVSVAGAIDSETAQAVRTIVAAIPDGHATPVRIESKPLPDAGKRVVAQRDVDVPVLVVGFSTPGLGARDFAALLVMRAMIADIARGPAATSDLALERGVAVQYAYDVNPSIFSIAVSGSVFSPGQALEILERIVTRVSNGPMDSSTFKRYREMARGQWQLEALSLLDRADRLTSFALSADPSLNEAAILAQIDALNPADIQRVARAYFQKFVLALISPRQPG